MKHLIFSIVLVIYLSNAFAGTCTSISRTNYNPNSVLTSSALNADFNQLVSGHNSFDGGCAIDGTIEKSGLNSTDFAVPFNAIKNGCVISRTASDTVSVDRCQMSINGNFVKTDIATNLTWGCPSCSPESSSAYFYVYASGASSGSTLTLFFSTSAPNPDEYNDNGDRALGRIYNGQTSEISYAVENYVSGNLVSNIVNYSASVVYSAGPTYTIYQNVPWIDSVTATAPGGVNQYKINYKSGTFVSGSTHHCTASTASANTTALGIISSQTSDFFQIWTTSTAVDLGSHTHGPGSYEDGGTNNAIIGTSGSTSISGGTAATSVNTISFTISCQGVK